MRIGELAKLSGLTATRIRFYEEHGLIAAVQRKANGYRDYSAEAVFILQIIAGAQAAGFSLKEIRQLVPSGPDRWPHDQLLDRLKQKVGEIEVMKKRLEQSRELLLVIIDSIEDKPAGIACADNKKRVLDNLRAKGIVPRRS